MEGHHSFARENFYDALKAGGAVILSWWSLVTLEHVITVLTLIYMCFLVGEKVWKFYLFLRARKAAKEASNG